MNLLRSLRSAVAGAFFGFQSAFGAYSDATHASSDRGNIVYLAPSDTRHILPTWTRREILRKVQWLFENFGIVKEAVRGIARHTVGRGICLSLNTDDEEWNALGEADAETFLMSPDRVDLAGRRNGYEIQGHAVQQRIKQGEFIAAFVANPRWENAPCVQIFDAHEVESPEPADRDRILSTLGINPATVTIIDGIELDGRHCCTAIWVRGLDDKFTRIPKSEIVHWYHADATNQVRGVSDFAQAVAPLCDVRDLVRIVTKTAKQNSAIGMHIKKMVRKGGQGGIDKIRTLTTGTTGTSSSSQVDPNEPAYERLAGGGAVIYTDEDGDVKMLTPNSPSPLVEPFIRQVLMRDGLASVGGASSDFFWACADLSGAGQRFVVVKAAVFFEVLGDGLTGHLCNPLVVRYLIHRMATGKLRRPRKRILVPATPQPGEDAQDLEPIENWVEDDQGEWMNHIGWQLPARISIDRGDAVVEINQLNAGVETLATINDRRGRGWRPMVKQWFREFAYAARIAREMRAEWALKLWRASMPGSTGASPDAGDSEDPQKKKDGEDDQPGAAPVPAGR